VTRPWRIAVVGAGVNGLCSAIRLRERGYDVTIHATHATPDTTSDRAGALFTPFGADNDTRLLPWIEVSRSALEQLALEAPAESGVRLAEVREYLSGTGGRSIELRRSMPGARLLSAREPYRHIFESNLPHIDVLRYMPYLQARFEALGGHIIRDTIDDFTRLVSRGYEGVVNCTGLGARRLARDPLLVPMRGQVVHAPNDLGLETSLIAEESDGAITYIVPFGDHVVLGGTYERRIEEAVTDEATLAAIVERARRLLQFDGHPRADELGRIRLRAWSGIRPVRTRNGHDEEIRLERENLADGAWVVHNYGHGRSGFTLSWGCAADVVELVKS